MTARDRLNAFLAILLPWPTRQQRKAAIDAARAARDAARAKVVHADQVRHDINRIAHEDNHFAQRTMNALRGGPNGG